MNTKRMGKWVIVLFLLAALPGMTAVMAQGQEPPEKEMAPAAVTDVGESSNVQYGRMETEPNNTIAQANMVDYIDAEVMGGTVANGDVDWYKFQVNVGSAVILVNTDARIDGQATDTVVELYDSAGNLLSVNDDMGGGEYDSLLFHVNRYSGWYYVRVSDFGSPCTANCYYEVMIGRALLVSAAAAGLGTGYVAGIPFRSEDILALTPLQNDHAGNRQYKWVMLMDGSDIGITKGVVNISLGWAGGDGGSLAMSFASNQVLPDDLGVNRVFKPWDWAVMAFDRVGPNTLLEYSGSGYPYLAYHAGSEHGLTTAAEKPDALDVNFQYAPNPPTWTANIHFSTAGAASVPKTGGGILKIADEDVFQSATWENNTTGWQNSMHFDGSTVSGLAGEDIIAADFNTPWGLQREVLVILGTGKVLGHNVTQKDVFTLEKSGSTWVWLGMAHLPDYGWNYNIDAMASGGN